VRTSHESLVATNRWEWSKRVAQVRRRDGVCVWSDDSCDGRVEVDHIVSRYEGGGDEMSNLRLLCRSHHVRRHNGLTPQSPATPRSPFQRRPFQRTVVRRWS